MTKVERDNGWIDYSQLEGHTVLTITLEDIHPEDHDQMDRILQFTMVDMGIDTSWQIPPPDPKPEDLPVPDPEAVPTPQDVPPENMPTGEVPVP